MSRVSFIDAGDYAIEVANWTADDTDGQRNIWWKVRTSRLKIMLLTGIIYIDF